MRIGVPTEIKPQEYRVAITPAGVRELRVHGHDVLVEAGAGRGSAITDSDFAAAGATIVPQADDVWQAADLVLKVKEPIEPEYARMRPGQVLFTFLHLAASRECTQALLDRQVTAIAYETVQLDSGALPLLAPMSEVAGRLAPQMGAQALLRVHGGRGVLLGGVPGVRSGSVTILGAGVAGLNAAAIAAGMGADVTLLDRSIDALRAADRALGGRVRTVASSALEIEESVLGADLVIGAVLVPGAAAPKLVSNDLVKRMRPGSVLIDIAIDQGGCFADSRPTTHEHPTFAVHESVFYCVANMPGAVPHTSTHALTNVTIPYAVQLAEHGWRQALRSDAALGRGLSTHDGRLVSEPVAQAFGLPVTDLSEVLA